ncbi:MAG: alpha/beta hydrolase [Terracidiphilus sp.]
MPPAVGRCVTGPARTAGFQRSIELRGPAGRLEAVLNEGLAGAPFAALVCHPHPLGGGTMHNKVVYQAMKVFNATQWGFRLPVLRFNFRGAGLSEGSHHGAAEAADVEAALGWLENEFRRPIFAAGFSFGAAMTLSACCGGGKIRKSVRALALLGLPSQADGRDYSYSHFGACSLPKLFLSGDHDPYAPAACLQQLAAAAAEPRRLVLIPGADHFFSGHMEAMQQALAAWLKEQTQ